MFLKKNPFTLRLRTRTSVRKRKVYGTRIRIPEYGSGQIYMRGLKDRVFYTL